MQSLEDVLEYVEKMLMKYGAVPDDSMNETSRDMLGLRTTYRLGHTWFRVYSSDFDGRTCVVISGIDDEKYASVGIEDDLAVFPADYPEEKIEKEVRFLLEIEPYPEEYPVY